MGEWTLGGPFSPQPSEVILWGPSLGIGSLGFPCGSAGKESTDNAGDLGLIPGLGRSPGEGKTTHSSILAWRIPWTVQSWGCKESDTTEPLSLGNKVLELNKISYRQQGQTRFSPTRAVLNKIKVQLCYVFWFPQSLHTAVKVARWDMSYQQAERRSIGSREHGTERTIFCLMKVPLRDQGMRAGLQKRLHQQLGFTGTTRHSSA